MYLSNSFYTSHSAHLLLHGTKAELMCLPVILIILLLISYCAAPEEMQNISVEHNEPMMVEVYDLVNLKGIIQAGFKFSSQSLNISMLILVKSFLPICIGDNHATR